MKCSTSSGRDRDEVVVGEGQKRTDAPLYRRQPPPLQHVLIAEMSRTPVMVARSFS